MRCTKLIIESDGMMALEATYHPMLIFGLMFHSLQVMEFVFKRKKSWSLLASVLSTIAGKQIW